MQRVETITIAGGGNAGLLTALALDVVSDEAVAIRIIDDFTEDPPSVGKGTYRSITQLLHEFLRIDKQEFIEEVEPVFKIGVWFQDGHGNEFHTPFTEYVDEFPLQQQEAIIQKRHIERDSIPSTAQLVAETGKTPFSIQNDGIDQMLPHAYQFEVGAVNDYLKRVCDRRGIHLINTRITDVHTNTGDITSLTTTDGQSYTSDLFVDATGSARILATALDRQTFHAYDSPVNAAVHVTTSRTNPVRSATVVTSTPNGWAWEIDTHTTTSYGRVFNQDYTSHAAQTEKLVDSHDVPESDVGTKEFLTGRYAPAWVGNCVCIGTSAGFIEPLQATTTTVSGNIGKVLASVLEDTAFCITDRARELFNTRNNVMWDDQWVFVALHYATQTGGTPFWDAATAIDTPQPATELVELYDRVGLKSINSLLEPVEFEEINFRTLSYPYMMFLLNALGVSSVVDTQSHMNADRERVTELYIEAEETAAERAQQHVPHDKFYDVKNDYFRLPQSQ